MTGLTRRKYLGGLSSVSLLAVGGARAASGPGDLSSAGLPAAGGPRAASDPGEGFDLVIKGGEVVDPSQALRARRDVGIRSGRIAALEADIPAGRARRVLDAAGRLVLPGPVDLHAHFHRSGSAGGVAASCGIDSARAQASARVECSGARVGVRVDMSEATLLLHGLEPLRRSLQARAPSGRPLALMVDIGGIPTFDLMSRTLDLLRPGDILTQCYGSRPNASGQRIGIVGNGRLLPAALAAKRRGVVFDIGRGTAGLDFTVAEAAIAQGAPPDTISPDLYVVPGSARGLPRLSATTGKLLHLGLGLDAVVAMATSVPARAIGRGGELGTLRVGAPGDLAVVERVETARTVVDAGSNVRRMAALLRPAQIVSAGLVFA